MKKNILLAILPVLISSYSFSQVSFGLHAGGNLAFTHLKLSNGGSDDKVSTDPRFGFTGGVVSEFQLGPVSLRPEVNYIQKGFIYNKSRSFFGTDATTDNKALLNYIEVPVNVTFNIPASTSHFFVGIGPVFSFGLSGKYKAKGTIGSLSNESTTDIKFDGEKNPNDDNIHLKSFDFGADAIVGYKLTGGFTLSMAYTQGFSNILPNGDSNDVWRNSGLNLKIGYMFGTASNTGSKNTGGSSNGSSNQ